MSGYASEYLHAASVGDREQAEAFADRAGALLSALYHDGRLEGYQLMVIGSEEEAIDELVPVADSAAVTGGRYPFVFVRAQPAEGQDAAALVAPLEVTSVR